MKNISTIKDRILFHIASIGISKRSFYDKTGIANGTLDKPGGVSEQLLEKYISAYPEINLDWLISGIGNMVRGEVDSEDRYEVEDEKVHFSSENVLMELREPDEPYHRSISAEISTDEKGETLIIKVPGLFKRISKLEGAVKKLSEEIRRMKGETG